MILSFSITKEEVWLLTGFSCLYRCNCCTMILHLGARWTLFSNVWKFFMWIHHHCSVHMTLIASLAASAPGSGMRILQETLTLCTGTMPSSLLGLISMLLVRMAKWAVKLLVRTDTMAVTKSVQYWTFLCTVTHGIKWWDWYIACYMYLYMVAWVLILSFNYFDTFFMKLKKNVSHEDHFRQSVI